MPASTFFHRQYVASATPILRQISPTGAPISACVRERTICSHENFFLSIGISSPSRIVPDFPQSVRTSFQVGVTFEDTIVGYICAEIFNSDQGSRFQSITLTNVLRYRISQINVEGCGAPKIDFLLIGYGGPPNASKLKYANMSVY